jgi:hypothetical protein
MYSKVINLVAVGFVGVAKNKQDLGQGAMPQARGGVTCIRGVEY